MASWSRDPWQLENKCQAIKDTLDDAESQSAEKTNIRQNVSWRDHMPCLYCYYRYYHCINLTKVVSLTSKTFISPCVF